MIFQNVKPFYLVWYQIMNISDRKGYDKLGVAKKMQEELEEKITRFHERIITEREYIIQKRFF